MIQAQEIELKKLTPNKGQIEGVPTNPRKATKRAIENMKKSIEETPLMLEVNELTAVRIADLDAKGALGVTYIGKEGKSTGILLNSKFFDRKRKTIEKDVIAGYNSGFKNRTNRPLQHTITHELAHATWNASMSSTKAKAAGKEISALYKKWMKDDKKKGYGAYGRTSVSEFFAEGVTKAIHGNADKYTKKLKKIVSKYQL